MTTSVPAADEPAMNPDLYGQSVQDDPAWADALIRSIEGLKEAQRQRRLCGAGATETAESIRGDAA